MTSRMLDVLGGVGGRAVLNEVTRYELFADGRVATVSLGRPDLVIERSVLAGELGELAAGAGARVALGRRFVGLRARGETMGVRLEHATTGAVEEVVAKTVIGGRTERSALSPRRLGGRGSAPCPSSRRW